MPVFYFPLLHCLSCFPPSLCRSGSASPSLPSVQCPSPWSSCSPSLALPPLLRPILFCFLLLWHYCSVFFFVICTCSVLSLALNLLRCPFCCAFLALPLLLWLSFLAPLLGLCCCAFVALLFFPALLLFLFALPRSYFAFLGRILCCARSSKPAARSP